MPDLYVCPLSRVAETLEASGSRDVVSLLAAPVPPQAGSGRHLILDLSDIAAPRPGYRLPGSAHVASLLEFVGGWDRSAPLLIHCYAGVSRSTAAAFIVACHLAPDLPERAHAARLRAASPTATPNPRLVALADAALGRRGRMVEAIEGIGRGAECFEGNVFRLALDPTRTLQAPGPM